MSGTELDNLLDYLREHGGHYSPEALREHLLAQGYAPESIDAALSRYLREREPALVAALVGKVFVTGIVLVVLSMTCSKDISSSPLLSSLLESFLGVKSSNLWLASTLVPLVSAVPLGLLLIFLGLKLGRDRVWLARVGLILVLAALWVGALGLLILGGCAGFLSLFLTPEKRQQTFAAIVGLLLAGLALIVAALLCALFVSAALKRRR
jgi:hypothetical protein